jgi:hypothetical protein
MSPRAIKLQGHATNIVAAASFTQLLGIDVPVGAVNGQFVVTGNISEDPAKVDVQPPTGYLYSAAEIRVVGIIGVERFTLCSGAVGSRRRTWSYAFVQGVDGRNWEKLAVESRFILDGTTGDFMKTAFDVLYPTGVSPIVTEIFATAFINVGGD